MLTSSSESRCERNPKKPTVGIASLHFLLLLEVGVADVCRHILSRSRQGSRSRTTHVRCGGKLSHEPGCQQRCRPPTRGLPPLRHLGLPEAAQAPQSGSPSFHRFMHLRPEVLFPFLWRTRHIEHEVIVHILGQGEASAPGVVVFYEPTIPVATAVVKEPVPSFSRFHWRRGVLAAIVKAHQ